MKAANGFVTDDGTFFESPIDAELYEAEQALDEALGSGVEWWEGEFKQFCVNHTGIIRRYLDAVETKDNWISDNEPSGSGGSRSEEGAETASVDYSEHVTAEEAVKTVQQFEAGGSQPVRPVGRGLSAEALSELQSQLSPRVRGGDASSVRGSEDMATLEESGLARARPGDGDPDIREQAVDRLRKSMHVERSDGELSGTDVRNPSFE